MKKPAHNISSQDKFESDKIRPGQILTQADQILDQSGSEPAGRLAKMLARGSQNRPKSGKTFEKSMPGRALRAIFDAPGQHFAQPASRLWVSGSQGKFRRGQKLGRPESKLIGG